MELKASLITRSGIPSPLRSATQILVGVLEPLAKVDAGANAMFRAAADAVSSSARRMVAGFRRRNVYLRINKREDSTPKRYLSPRAESASDQCF
jgi:hypothetical protein